jgi:cytochrome c peroxidase
MRRACYRQIRAIWIPEVKVSPTCLALATLCQLLCGGVRAETPQPASRAEVFAHVQQAGALGLALFSDPSLSASGQQSCASCHRPDRAFGPPDAAPVQFGGPDLRQRGLRAVPSLMYLQASPQFTEHYFESEDEADESIDNGPTGGLTWDGRVDHGRDQARIPLLSPFEMANRSPAAVVEHVRHGPLASTMREVYGDSIFNDNDRAFAAILEALETAEQNNQLFYPYSSKYDDVLAGRAHLTAQEARGLAAFNDPARGNCAHCHTSARGRDGAPPQFTDYGFIALGVPRNPEIPANQDSKFHDLGLCGPERKDLADHPAYCGLFKTPSLRNVALRQVFFHNGMFHSLKQAVAFYARRDTNPAEWYPSDAHGTVRKFDDLPQAYQANISQEPPFGGKPGGQPPLTEADIDDIVAFLATLTDRPFAR